MTRAAVALVLAIAGCGGDADRLDRRTCDAVLAHLVVLEQRAEGPGGPLCKYHPSCGGTAQRQWQARCPIVVSRGTARCYQGATSLTSADDCLPRAELDDRIQAATGGDLYGGDEPPPWMAGAIRGPTDRALDELGRLRRDACGCGDRACADEVTERLDAWTMRYRHLDRSARDQERASVVNAALGACLRAARDGDPPDAIPYTPPPDAAPRVDPWRTRPDAAVTGGFAIGLPECDALVAAWESYMTCDKVPASMRDSLADAYEEMRRTWTSLDVATMPQPSRDAMADGCKQTADGLRQGLDALGCP
jgi:hypothetical protein